MIFIVNINVVLQTCGSKEGQLYIFSCVRVCLCECVPVCEY